MSKELEGVFVADPAQVVLRERVKAKGAKAVAAEVGIGVVALLRAASGSRVQRATAKVIESAMAVEGGA